MRARDRVSRWMTAALDAGAFPAASAAAGGPNRDLFRIEQTKQGGSDRRLVYDLASLSKVIGTTMVCLRLIDRGEIRLDDPLSRYHPVPPGKAAITIRDLLRHAGGFEAYFLLDDSTVPDGVSRTRVLDALMRRPLAYPPGSDVVYSCIGFIVLGLIMEIVTSTTLDDAVRELVLDPLGMTHTGYRPGVWVGAVDAILPTEPDPATGVAVHGVVHDENARFLGGVAGNAGLFSCLDDCVTFARLLLNRCTGFLSRSLFDEMVRNWTPGLADARGLGVSLPGGTRPWPGGRLLGDDAFGHTGFTGTSIFVSPSRELFFVLLTNRVNYGRDASVMPDYRARYHEAVIGEADRRSVPGGEGGER
ncbi:MAG: class A beta-lactamase-related serine hydrolase [Spirochaetaceae bacterium]|nr:MAG: class A beta-lactamase-related serine hydrolase [Spirochaetaceae bacterium]